MPVPSTLTRYLLREILLPLTILVSLTVVVGATTQLVKAAGEVSGIGIPMSALLKALPLALPSLFGMGMPVAFVLSLLVAFGRMAEERELLALAAAGVSSRQLLKVPLTLAVCFTGFGMFMTLYAEPRTIHQLRSMLADAAAGYFGEALEPGVLHDQVPGVTIYFGEKNDTGIKNIVLIDERTPTEPRLFVADSGQIDKQGGVLRFVLENGEVHLGRARDAVYRRVRFDELVWRVDPGPLIRGISAAVPSVNAMPISELRARASDETQEPFWYNYYNTNYARKFTFPVANLVFVLLAFPVTTIFSRASRIWTYAAVALMTGLYFTLTQAVDPLLKLGLSAAQAAWVPNILFGLIGLCMTVWRLRK